MCKAIDDIYEDGVIEGCARGRAEGRAEGRAQGRAEGRAQEREELIIKMLGKGKSVEEIADICDFEYDMVQQIQKKCLM